MLTSTCPVTQGGRVLRGHRSVYRRPCRVHRSSRLHIKAFKEDVTPNVKEAREWIQAWQAKQNAVSPPEAAAAAPAAAAPKAASTVTLTIQYSVNFGDSVKLVGADPVFGAWDVAAAPSMTWGEGDVWFWSGELPAGEYELKAVIARGSGAAEWEQGDNRRVVVPGASKLGSSYEACLLWGSTGAIELAPAAPAEQPAAEQPEVSEPAAAEEEEEERGGDGRGRGSGAVVAAAAVSSEADVADLEELRAAAAVREGYAALAATLESSDAEEPPAAEAAAEESAAAAGSETAAAVAAAEEEDMSAAGQVAAAALGVAAAAVVAWSEYTLLSTGCGLPPGPNGLLGAAEGLSYVAVAAFAAWGVLRRGVLGRGLPGAAAAAEWASYGVVATGLLVLSLHVRQYGSIPSALPDSRCFAAAAAAPAALSMEELSAAVKRVAAGVQLGGVHVDEVAAGLKRAAAGLRGVELPSVGKLLESLKL